MNDIENDVDVYGNLYFLESTDFPNHFMHYEGKNENGSIVYALRKGCIMAAAWKKHKAEKFIEINGINNLKLSKCSDVIKRSNVN